MEFQGIPKSKVIRGFTWVGDHVPYPEKDIYGDTYPITWADDGELYASAGDPNDKDKKDGLVIDKFAGTPPDYKITHVNLMPDYTGLGGYGVKPSGMICVKGTLYLAFQNMLLGQTPPHSLRSQHGSDAHIVFSYTKGWMWSPTRANIPKPMFPGYKFGGPSFVQHGKDNDTARDDFVYAVSSDQWDNGSNLRLGRVPQDEIIRPESWQWVGAWNSDGFPVWTHKLDDSLPILSIYKHVGLPEMVYLADIRRYLLLTWRLREDFNPDTGTDLLILESPEPWGPFSLVHYEELWEGVPFTPYCPRVPLKWMEPGHRSGWIQFSGGWNRKMNPKNTELTYYRSNIRKFQLELF